MSGWSQGGVTPPQTIGGNVASATPSTTTSADLVSAATNTGGIIITSFSMGCTGTSNPASMSLTVNGSVVMKINARGGTAPNDAYIGGFCTIKIPAGQAVGYSCIDPDLQGCSVYLTWKAA